MFRHTLTKKFQSLTLIAKLSMLRQKLLLCPVKLTIKVESLIGTDLTVSYGGPIGTGLLITGALAFLSSRMPNYDKAIETAESNRILVHLCEFNQLSLFLKKWSWLISNLVQVASLSN